jgi:hypothetical protein
LPVVLLGVNPRMSVGGSPLAVNATDPVNPAFRVIVSTGCTDRMFVGCTR